MENHNFKQPNQLPSPQQIFTQSRRRLHHGLITRETRMRCRCPTPQSITTPGWPCNPSEPNYVWAEGGTDFGVHTDNDPSAASANVFNAPHLTRQLNMRASRGKIMRRMCNWLRAQRTAPPAQAPRPSILLTATANIIMPRRHKPMAFYTDTQIQNVSALTQLFEMTSPTMRLADTTDYAEPIPTTSTAR